MEVNLCIIKPKPYTNLGGYVYQEELQEQGKTKQINDMKPLNKNLQRISVRNKKLTKLDGEVKE
jgi:hypothetical protein